MLLSNLRKANIERNREWDKDSIVTASFRGLELGWDVGELLNVIKKLERERLGIRGSRDTVEHLAEELADVFICADLIGMRFGIDIGRAVVEKFNRTSSNYGLATRLK